MKRILLSIWFLCIAIFLQAAQVDTLVVYSNSMKKNTKTCIIIPNSYNKTDKPSPVLYLLHGYSGNYQSWLNFFPQVKQFADQYSMIIVCVDGNFSSWYFDSPIDSTMRYETYVINELIRFIDSTFNTIKSRNGRAISGLSMGGHGALYLSMRHQDIFGAVGSMSGCVDFRPFSDKFDLDKRLGKQDEHPDNWEKNTVIYQLYRLNNNNLSIIIDCGIDDFFIEVNRQLHNKMLYLNIKHDYIERPGEHSIEYWNNAIQYQILYFHNFFKSNLSTL